jgi:excisionase family DNA binding protein
MHKKLPELIKASTAYLIVSKRIEVSKPTVYRWIDEERFGIPVKIGASVYVRRTAIEDYLDSLTADS